MPCSATASAARSASVNTVASRQATTRFIRTALSPDAAPSLVCMSMQAAQPLIWLMRRATSSCVVAGSGSAFISLPNAMRCFIAFAGGGVGEVVEASVHGVLLGARADVFVPGTRQRARL